jgi:hypothetical protein
MRLSLEDCDVEKDITGFIKDQGTGQEIPDPPKFINFCRGDAETSSQVSEDDNYSVAQFARTMNPTYRTSSPQPSMFESHHDPNNPLAKELGLQQDTQPILEDEIDVAMRPAIPQDQINIAPRQSQDQISIAPEQQAAPPQEQRNVTSRQSRAPPYDPMELASRHSRGAPQEHIEAVPRQSRGPPQDHINVSQRQAAPPPQPMQPAQTQRNIQPDPRLIQAQQQARQNYQQSQVPHNDYPTDGMTQYCRIGPPSDRSTIPSPVRPGSRDSQSDYSNPTSFSSIEPPSGSASPGKPVLPRICRRRGASSTVLSAAERVSTKESLHLLRQAAATLGHQRQQEGPPTRTSVLPDLSEDLVVATLFRMRLVQQVPSLLILVPTSSLMSETMFSM